MSSGKNLTLKQKWKALTWFCRPSINMLINDNTLEFDLHGYFDLRMAPKNRYPCVFETHYATTLLVHGQTLKDIIENAWKTLMERQKKGHRLMTNALDYRFWIWTGKNMRKNAGWKEIKVKYV